MAAYPSLPWNIRAIMRTMDLVPALRTMRCLRYRFGNG